MVAPEKRRKTILTILSLSQVSNFDQISHHYTAFLLLCVGLRLRSPFLALWPHFSFSRSLFANRWNFRRSRVCCLPWRHASALATSGCTADHRVSRNVSSLNFIVKLHFTPFTLRKHLCCFRVRIKMVEELATSFKTRPYRTFQYNGEAAPYTTSKRHLHQKLPWST